MLLKDLASLGALLLSFTSFETSLIIMALILALMFILLLINLKTNISEVNNKSKKFFLKTRILITFKESFSFWI